MKNFKSYISVITFFLFLSASNVFAQWATDIFTGHMYNTNASGFVGIGTQSPLWKLHVAGDIGVGVDNAIRWNNNRAYLSPDQGGSIELGNGYGHPHIGDGPGTSDPDQPYIDFHWGLNNTGQDFNTRIINSANNQLEFNTSTASSMIFNGTGNPFLKLTNSSSSGATIKVQTTTGSMGIDFWPGNGNQGLIDFYTDYNNLTFDEMSIKNDHTIGFNNDESWIGASNSDQGGSLHLNTMGSDPYGKSFIDFSSGQHNAMGPIDARIINSTGNQLDFWTNCQFGNFNAGNKMMSINNTGVYTKALFVRSSWSDFVFKPGYNLTPLAEVENYIKENGHLSDIPTEQEVSENGVEVGDISAKLLQKVEELTLYVIDQKKEIDKVKEDNQKLRDELLNLNKNQK